MRCLVTGAAGGIGYHLCNMLKNKGHEVIGLDNYSVGKNKPKCKVLKGDVSDYLCPFPDKIDWVFHLAARADIVPSISDPLVYHQANVTGTINMLEYAREAKVKRFIYAASSSCYGIPKQYPTTEKAKINPQYPYALTKWLGEQYVLHYAKVYGLGAISLRLFNVFGPHFRTSGTYGAVFGVFLSQLANKKPLTIVGDGEQKRDFIYVDDVCEAFIKAAESDISGDIFNIGTEETQSINYLVSLLGKTKKVYLPKRPGEPDITHADISKAMDKLNWQPHVSFEKGVSNMLEHLEDYKKAPLWDKTTISEATRDWFKYLGR